MNRSLPALWLVLLAGPVLPLIAQQSATSRALSVSSANDVVRQWTPDQHLYVKGDLGVSADRLATLESWLDANAPHWTVVLMHDAQDESVTTADGRHFSGLDAVEHALGHGLANRTIFGELEHAKTEERDGAVFVLFLQERAFSYYASDAQNSRSLGEANWLGELDRPAFRAMRNGGRVLDAVKDTITAINTQLERVVRQEEIDRANIATARQQAVAEVRALAETVRDHIDQVQALAVEISEQLPEATGDLTRPDVDRWTTTLQELELAIDEDNVHAIDQQLTMLNNEIAGHLNAFAIQRGMPARSAALSAEIEALRAERGGQSQATAAAELLTAAHRAHQNGDADLKQILLNVENKLQEGKVAVAAERQRVRQKWAKRRLRRNAILATLAVAALIFALVALVLNRRRRPARQRAIAALAEREKTVKAEMDRVLELFGRSNEVLGDRKKLAQRGYAGHTKNLSNETLDHVDDLLVMSGEVDRVIREARELIQPTDPLHALANAISSGRYERGINRISGEPLTFNQDSGIPTVLSRKRQRGDEQPPPQEITLTFEEVFEAFRDRCQQTNASLDTLETSLLKVNDEIDALQSKIDKVTELDRQLALVAEEDDYFDLPALFDVLIPSAQADVDKADQVSGLDPVQAMHQQLPRGNRKMEAALAITRIASDARKTLFPELREHTPRLEQMSYRTRWIEERITELGDRANALLQAAVTRDIQFDAITLQHDVETLGQNVRTCIEFAKQLQRDDKPSIETLQERMVATRAEIGQSLGIHPANLLSESTSNPDAHLDDARQQVTAVEAAINIGNVEGAKKACQALKIHVDRGNSIVDQSLEILASFPESWPASNHEYEEILKAHAERSQRVLDLRSQYAASALYFHAAGKSHHHSSSTLETHLALCQPLLRTSRSQLDASQEQYQTGKMLAADQTLADAQSSLSEVEHLLTDIDGHVQTLQRAESDNARALRQLLDHFENLHAQLEDHRTTQPTMDAYYSTKQALAQSARVLEAPTQQNDPFIAAAEIAKFEQHSIELDAMIASDRNAHAEAARAVSGAEDELQAALNLVHRAHRDDIPDSTETRHAIAEIRARESPLRQVRRQLETPHEDWSDVARQSADVHAQLAAEAGRLRGELQHAEECVKALQRASREVSAAAGYSGGFGVLVHGTPGVDDLQGARAALANGDYDHMLQLARAAETQARHAILQAQRRIASREREAARRAEAARRVRQRAAQPSVMIPTGSGSSRGHAGVGQTSRPAKSLGRTYKNSGFSRSGW